MMKSTVLLTEKLGIGYPDKEIAAGDPLQLTKGKLTAVIGVNGSGKTTLLKTMVGDLVPQRGKVFLFEKPIQAYNQRERSKHISLVLSNPAFSQYLTVYEVVALGRHPYTNWLGLLSEADKEAINQALWKIGISDIASQICGELSDGQLQKVFIARALAQNTDLMVLDEPTSHLDLYHKAFIFKLLKKLATETQKAIILATHELNLALQLCDNLILINHHKFIQNTPENLIQQGHLAKIFPDDLIRFDEKSGSFKINH